MRVEPAHAEHLAEHFGDREAQDTAARLGMWVFLATELLLFGGLFTSYAFYRSIYGESFVRAATQEMEVGIGTVNTFLLLGTSVLVALAVSFVRREHPVVAGLCLFLAIALGVAFLALKLLEYSHHAAHGALPGRWYRVWSDADRGAEIFILLYFLMTGLHAIHMTVGTCILTVLGFQCLGGKYSLAWHTPLEVGAMYWHFVDVVWIFLYPLFYLLSRR